MKKGVLIALIHISLLGSFNALFFILGGFDHSASAWIGYSFIHFAYLMNILTPFLVPKCRESAIFSVPPSDLSSIYFVITFLVGLLFIFLNSANHIPALVVHLALTGLYVALLCVMLLADQRTADSLNRQQAEVAFVKEAAARVKLLASKAADRNEERLLEQVYDTIHASPTRSTPTAATTEAQITGAITALENAVYGKNAADVKEACTQILALVESRNAQCQLAN